MVKAVLPTIAPLSAQVDHLLQANHLLRIAVARQKKILNGAIERLSQLPGSASATSPHDVSHQTLSGALAI